MNKLIPVILSLIVRFIRVTHRYTYYDLENIEAARKLSARGNYALAVWHQNLFAGIISLREKIIGMTSRSKDGSIAGDTAERIGILTARGSSSKGGKAAMQVMIDLTLKTGRCPSLTVDGPRGPAKEPKRGLFKIAHDCKISVVPYFAISTNTKTFEKSWDKFRFPKPFGHMHVFYGKPFMIDRLDEESLDSYAQNLKDQLHEIEVRALKLL